jgi:hypothetical protein
VSIKLQGLIDREQHRVVFDGAAFTDPRALRAWIDDLAEAADWLQGGGGWVERSSDDRPQRPEENEPVTETAAPKSEPTRWSALSMRPLSQRKWQAIWTGDGAGIREEHGSPEDALAARTANGRAPDVVIFASHVDVERLTAWGRTFR